MVPKEVQRFGGKGVMRLFELEWFYTAFQYEFDENFSYPVEYHDFWELVLAEGGTVETTVEENIYLLKRNDLLLIQPMSKHRTRTIDNSHPKGYVVTFGIRGQMPPGISEGVFSLTDEEAESCSQIARQTVTYLHGESDLYFGQELADRLAAFLVTFSRHLPRCEQSLQPDMLLYKSLVTTMQNNVDSNLRMQSIAEQNHISVSYLKYIFNKYTSVSPKSYYMMLQTTRAINLMKTGASIKTIADRMQFSSRNYFTVFFKRQTGVSPAQYQQMLLRDKR